MKLIGLNTWGGHEFEPMMDFIKEHKDSTDIFCFQEIFKTDSDHKSYKTGRVNLLEEISAVLEDFSFKFTPMLKGMLFGEERVSFGLEIGLAIFYRKNLELKQISENLVLKHDVPMDNPGDESCSIQLQIADFKCEGKDLTIINTHGMTYPVNKLDTERRILQSQTIIDVLNNKEGEAILTGDFNLLPETKSIKMIDEKLRNLIKEFKITQTRSILTGYRGKPDEQFFADYTFVTPGIKAKGFKVPDINISDHLPMILDFEL